MAESAVSFLLDNLTIWLQEERKLLGRLRDEVQIIDGELRQMRAFLRAADAQEQTDPRVKEWVRQVREIAYDTEDVLESYMFRFAGHPSRGIVGHIHKYYSSIKNLKAKQKMAAEIKSIRYRAQNASETFKDLYAVLPELSSNAVASDTCYDGRGDALLLEEADVVGIERPKRQLLRWISTGDYTLKVISVVGMAGMGKTTLVKKVYDDLLVKENFDHHVWITISQTYKEESILRELIKQLYQEVKQALPQGLETMNVDDLKGFIYKFLQNEKYIIVMDDVWSAEVWKALQYVFPRSNTRGWGCIIITTRLNNIGNAASSEKGDHVYHLKELPMEEAKDLFDKKAFRGDPCPDYLEKLSENILKRCNGLPLAIVVIGGALAMKGKKIEEWMKFDINFESEIEDDNIKRIWKLLSFSYYDLPYYLKACFLYLSIYPEDTLVEKASTIRLWMTEGLVEAKQGKTMEEIAEGYLNELSNRSLIQVATISQDGRPRNFRIHDLVREYIISKAREHDIVAIKSSREIALEDRIRRLVLGDCSVNYNEVINKLKYLHSLLFLGSVDSKWGSIICKILHGNCRMLKVLDLRGAPIDEIPNEVFKLYHLKCLSLRNTNVSLIPELIGQLLKLEILDLKNSKVVELPVEILRLRRLRYLVVYKYKEVSTFDYIQSFHAPYEIGQLMCLQKLCYIDADERVVEEIGKLNQLRRLGILKLRMEDGKDLCASLANLTYLSSLCISALQEDEVIDMDYHVPPTYLQFLRLLDLGGRFEKLPQWIPSLNALTDLCLRWSKIRDEDLLEYLQGLPNLKILYMEDAYDGESLSFKPRGFEKLTELKLIDMERLRWVKVEKESMPSLTKFIIQGCKAMMERPMGVEHLMNLSCLGFNEMREELVEKLFEEKRQEGHQWKLAHVPEIYIGNMVADRWEWRWV